MALRTILLESVLENLVLQNTGKTKYDFETFDDLILQATDYIFEDYPIFDENYRKPLEVKILSHYYFRELSTIPFGRWKFFLNRDMKERMPYFNELYQSQLDKYEIFENYRMTETLDRDLTATQEHTNKRTELENDKKDEETLRSGESKIDTNETQTGTSKELAKNVYEDTPYNSLGNKDYATNITDSDVEADSTVGTTGSQASNQDTKENKVTDNVKEFESESKNEMVNANTEDYIKTRFGFNSSQSKPQLIMDFRKSLIEVDLMVIDALKDNFSGYFN